MRVILEDEPRGKGHAVRAAFAEATGTIILIQDADFEYDLDDYEARSSRSSSATRASCSVRQPGLDNWKVRRTRTPGSRAS